MKHTARVPIVIPDDADRATLTIDGRDVHLTNLRKTFWPALGLVKADLLRYYATVADALLPHLADRAMVMKRYPNGAAGEWFFMKRAPEPRPAWIETCSITHGSGNVIAFPIVQDLASLLWLVNLGCIDLNPWYARCDDTDRPDFLHFDLDPGPGADFDKVREVALRVRDILGGTVRGPDGSPLGGVAVRAFAPHDTWVPTALTVTDADGAYAVPDLRSGDYDVAFRPAPGSGLTIEWAGGGVRRGDATTITATASAPTVLDHTFGAAAAG